VISATSKGKNITIEYRFANGRVGRLPELAADLVRLELDVIVTPGTPASMAAKKATSRFPHLRGRCRCGWGRARRNLRATGWEHHGVDKHQRELGGKRLELLKVVAPKASRVTVLYNPADRSNVLY